MAGAGGQLTLVPSRISQRAWAPFGWVPLPDTDPVDGHCTLSFEWGDPHLNVLCHDPDEVQRQGRFFVCGGLYHHVTHTQALWVLDVPAVIAVLPPSARPAEGDLDAMAAFVLERGDAIVLHRGTWHWGPFPCSDQPVHLLNLQSRRYMEDNEYAPLAEPVLVEAT